MEAALRVINSSLGEVWAAATTEPPLPSSPPSLPSELSRSQHPSVVGLYSSTEVVGSVSALLGKAGTPSTVKPAQIALRFPKVLTPAQSLAIFSATSPTDTPPDPTKSSLLSSHLREERLQRGGWHVDGMGKGKALPFSLLVACFLSDTPEDGAGQFTVFPGSHLYLSELLKSKGVDALYGESGAAARPDIPGMFPAVQLRVRAGDVCLAHPLLAHRVGINFSPYIRHAVFFRVSSLGHDAVRETLALGGEPFAAYKGLAK